MNRRTRSLWLPALASTLGASLAMTTLQWAGVRPHLIWTREVAFSFYWAWLALLPCFGGLGAFLSRREGGRLGFRLIACLAPVLWLLLMGLAIEPVELALNGVRHIRYLGYGLANWVAIPGAALLLGAVPFLGGDHAPERVAQS